MADKENPTSEQSKPETTQRGSGKLSRLLTNWIDRKVDLIFHLRGGSTVEGTLLYYTRYEYVVDPGDQKPAILIHKHAVDYVERKKA